MSKATRRAIDGDGPFFTLPPRWFTDPAILAREKDAIFYKSWRYVGHESDLSEAGSYITCRIVDQNIFLIRNRDGDIKAFHNVCRHRAHELLQGRGQVKARITCPYHAWAYDSDGALRSARLSDDVRGFDTTDFSLVPVRVESMLGLLFVNLDPDAAPFADQFAGLADEIASLVPAFHDLVKVDSERPRNDSDAQVDLKANWKVLMDNCSECYHCGPAHPAFVDLVDMASYTIEVRDLYTRHEMACIKPDNAAYDYRADTSVTRAVFWHLWPNMTLGVMPGSPNFDVFVFEPVDVEATRLDGDSFRLPDGAGETDAARSRYGSDVLWPEDRGLCESVQRGLHSRGYERGRFMVDDRRSAISEHVPAFFHHKVAEALGDV